MNLQRHKDQLVPYEVKSLGNQTDDMDAEVADKYEEFLKNKVSELKQVEDITTFTLDVADKSMDKYNRYININTNRSKIFKKWKVNIYFEPV